MGESNFIKLNNKNYDSWEFEVRAELKRKGVIDIVEGRESCPTGSNHTKAMKGWKVRVDLVAAEIIRRLEASQFAHVHGSEDDPEEMWRKLKDFHMAAGLGSLVALWGRFMGVPKAERITMCAHIGTIRTLADKLKSLGNPPSSALTVVVLLRTLPAAYDSLVTALDSNLEATKIDYVISCILNVKA